MKLTSKGVGQLMRLLSRINEALSSGSGANAKTTRPTSSRVVANNGPNLKDFPPVNSQSWFPSPRTVRGNGLQSDLLVVGISSLPMKNAPP